MIMCMCKEAELSWCHAAITPAAVLRCQQAAGVLIGPLDGSPGGPLTARDSSELGSD